MHLFSGDPLRDSIWQFIGVFLSIILWVLGLILPQKLFDKKEGEHISAYKALLLPDTSLGCGGLLLLLPLQAATAYCLAVVAHRVFLQNQIDQVTFFWTCLISVLVFTWTLSGIRHSTLSWALPLHLCIVIVLFSLYLVSVEQATFISKDFTTVTTFIAKNIPDLKQFPPFMAIHLNAVPVDIKVAHPASAKALLFWFYGITLAVVLFFYSLHKRHLARRATAWAYMDKDKRQAVLEELDKKDKEATIELKKLEHQDRERTISLRQYEEEERRLALDKLRLEVELGQLELEKKRAQYTLELAKQIVETLYISDNVEMKTEQLRMTIPSLQALGRKNGSKMILDHLHGTQHERTTSQDLPIIYDLNTGGTA